MPTEIERKFLVTSLGWKRGARGRLLRQGYLCCAQERTVRIRMVDTSAWLTIKGIASGIARTEFDYVIPVADARHLLDDFCLQPVIEKTRYEARVGDHLWEIDEFHGANDGLVIAEVELRHEDEAFVRPDWLGEEVSQDARYFNANLARNPYRAWAAVASDPLDRADVPGCRD